MKCAPEARSSGFTLVELLIVILIIAILSGMMMIATGSATDSAEAAKIVNDIRMAKSASLMLYVDERRWPNAASTAAAAASLDLYTDRPIFTGTSKKYDLRIVDASEDLGGGSYRDRTMIGIKPADKDIAPGVLTKLKNSAAKSGLYFSDAPPSGITGLEDGYVYMFLR
jgi:general secretion pathway protein G